MLWLQAPALAFGLALSDLEVEMQAEAGVGFREEIGIRNTSGGPALVKVYVQDWWYDETGHAFGPAGSHERSAAAWTTPSVTSLALGPGEHTEIHLSGHVPPAAQAGGYYGVVFFEIEPASSGVGAGLRFGTLFSVVVPGGTDPVASAGPLSIEQADGLRGSVDLTVAGERHMRGVLKYVVRGPDGSIATRGKSNSVRVLPGQTKPVRLDLDLSAGAYTLDGVVAFDASSLPVHSAFVVR